MGSAGVPGARAPRRPGCGGRVCEGASAPDEGPSVGCGTSGKGAAWGRAGARQGARAGGQQREAAQVRSSMGPRRAAAWGSVGTAQGRSVVRCRDAAVRCGAGALQCGAAQGRDAGLRRRAGWGCVGAVGARRAHSGRGEGGCGLVGGCAREGDGGAVSSAAERHRAADRAEERPGLAIVGRGARGARGVRGAAFSGGARTPLGGDECRRASSTGPNRGGGGGERHAVVRGRTGPGRAPPEGYRGGGRGWAPGLRGPGPWWLWAGAGETRRASGLRLVRGGVEGPGRLGGEPREAPGGWARAPEGGRPSRGGGGGCSLPGLRRGAAWCGAAAQPCGAAQGCSSVGPRRGAACGHAGVWRGAAQGRGVEPRMGAAWARRGAAQGRSAGTRMGVA